MIYMELMLYTGMYCTNVVFFFLSLKLKFVNSLECFRIYSSNIQNRYTFYMGVDIISYFSNIRILNTMYSSKLQKNEVKRLSKLSDKANRHKTGRMN